MLLKALLIMTGLAASVAFAQTRVAPRTSKPAAPPRVAPPPSFNKAAPLRSRPGVGRSFGAGTPLKRSVFVPNVAFEMKFASEPEIICPSYFAVIDEQVEEEGQNNVSYHGEAPMRWFSSSVKVVFESEDRAVWKGTLRPEFAECSASAIMSSWNGRSLKPNDGHISLVIKDGTATLTADISKYKNASFEKVGLLEAGRPYWNWELKE